MTDVKIDKNIPMPGIGINYGKYIDILRKMEVGDSILLSSQAEAGSLVTAARAKGKRFVSRKIASSEYRVWYAGPLIERGGLE